jgi:hypothetical protein
VPAFTDADGREWRLSLTINDIRRIRKEVDVDLADVGETTMERLGDPVMLVDVLHCLLHSECQSRGLDAVAFARSMRGDTLDQASTALLDAVIDFFPSRRRQFLLTLRDKSEALGKRMQERDQAILESDRLDRWVEAEIAAADRRLEQRLQALDPTFRLPPDYRSGDSSTSGPASSDSTPAF